MDTRETWGVEIVGRLLPVELEPTAKNERLADDMVRRREGGLFFFLFFFFLFFFSLSFDFLVFCCRNNVCEEIRYFLISFLISLAFEIFLNKLNLKIKSKKKAGDG